MTKEEKELFKVTAELYMRKAEHDLILYSYTRKLIKEKKYGATDDDGDDFRPLRIYLMNKHHWTPSTVMSMSSNDLRMALTEELKDFFFSAEESAVLKELKF